MAVDCKPSRLMLSSLCGCFLQAFVAVASLCNCFLQTFAAAFWKPLWPFVPRSVPLFILFFVLAVRSSVSFARTFVALLVRQGCAMRFKYCVREDLSQSLNLICSHCPNFIFASKENITYLHPSPMIFTR